MDVAKIVPWVLSTILAGVCWQQQQTISILEEEKTTLTEEVQQTVSDKGSSRRKVRRGQQKDAQLKQQKMLKTLQKQSGFVQPDQEQSNSEYDLEAMVEDRAWQRIEEIEEERKEERFERVSEYMQSKVDEWSEEYDWSEETQDSMMEILTTYVRGRVDFHAKLKNGSIERDQIRPYFEQLSGERNEAIIDLIGEDEFSELEDDLKPRGGPPR